MLKILAAELTYYKNTLIFYAIFCAAAFFVIWFAVRIEANQIPSMLLIMLVSALSVGNIQTGFFIKSKRLRWLQLLPVSRGASGDLRFMFPLVVWFGILLLFFALYSLLSLAAPRIIHPHLTHFLLINGLILIIESIYLINVDIRHLTRNKFMHLVIGLTWFLSFILALVPFYVLVNFAGFFGRHTVLQNQLLTMMNSMQFVLTLNVVGYAAYRLSYYIFQRREKFLE
jgi:hypothetical protein